ncbi:MAG: hypothetical protein BGO55_31605 [Sphingobacteriales bacterium 50-39]|nr:hypothetical protein [Sphingobacteriales bacterium]OJW61048.1 MAG: hypothetical protein BGO55_31605 [Sphingobacteriales bacterium 50-39]
MKKRTIVDIIASLFILLFVYTAMSKLYESEKFKWVLGKSPLISSFSDIISWLLPATELLVSGLLFMPRTRKIGLYSAFGLMTIFTLYIAYMILFAPKLPCSCGGIIQKMTWKQHLLFNIGFTILAGYAIWLNRGGNIKGKAVVQDAVAYS